MNFWIPNDEIQDYFGGNKERNIYPITTEYDWFRYYAWDGAASDSEYKNLQSRQGAESELPAPQKERGK